jgi:hypothetical protein
MTTRTVWTTRTAADARALHSELIAKGIQSFSFITAKGGTPSKASVTEARVERVAAVAAAIGIKVKLEIGTFDSNWRRIS